MYSKYYNCRFRFSEILSQSDTCHFQQSSDPIYGTGSQYLVRSIPLA